MEMAELLRTRYAKAEKVILVCDNLNTHTMGAFYEAFAPAKAANWCGAWSSATRPSTAVGSTSRKTS